jgi:probable rRNA maturation factor
MPASVRVQYGAVLSDKAPGDVDGAALHRLLARAVRTALKREGAGNADISVTLLSDDEIAAMNAQFLQHEGPTDVISFPLYDEDEDPVGDIYVGFEHVRRQAADNRVASDEELVRVTVHGVLHVLGHDHPEGDERLDSEMWRVQEAIVAGVMK